MLKRKFKTPEIVTLVQRNNSPKDPLQKQSSKLTEEITYEVRCKMKRQGYKSKQKAERCNRSF
jgi:hypothetical protein